MLSRIVSKVGKPLATDRLTASRKRMSYPRILVEVSADRPLKDKVLLRGPLGEEQVQEIHYEWRPWHCMVCKSFGHRDGECVKQKKVVQKWVRKEGQPAHDPTAGKKEAPVGGPVGDNVTVNPVPSEAKTTPPPGPGIVTRSAGAVPDKSAKSSWKKVVKSRLGKDPILAEDLEMEERCSQAADVITMAGSWERDRVVIAAPPLPNG